MWEEVRPFLFLYGESDLAWYHRKLAQQNSEANLPVLIFKTKPYPED